jgi:hypothetical protein
MDFKFKIRLTEGAFATSEPRPDPIEPIQKKLSVIVPNREFQELIEEHYAGRILDEAEKFGIRDIEYLIDPS